MNHRDAQVLLEPYLDGALVAADRWAVMAHLDDCPACRAYVAGQARLRGQVREQLASVAPPPGLEDRLRSTFAARPMPSRSPAGILPALIAPRVAAVLGPAIVALLLLSRVTAPAAGSEAALHGELAVAHAVFAQDESLLDVAGDAPLASGWFHEQAGIGVTVPELDGYEFLGGRLITVLGRPVAQLVYESHPEEAYLSLLALPASAAGLAGASDWPAASPDVHHATSVLTWETGSGWAALVGDVSAAELRRLADGLDGWPRAAATPAA